MTMPREKRKPGGVVPIIILIELDVSVEYRQ